MPAIIPPDLRQRLEDARLDNLALMRALDRMFRAGPPVPQPVLRAWYELEADCAEALAVLDRPPRGMDVRLMLRDTLASLERLPAARAMVRAPLDRRMQLALVESEAEIRAALDPAEAYSQVPGRRESAPVPRPSPAKAAAGRNDPCPCGSGKKYKKCCALRPSSEPTPAFRFEPGSYGGPGGFFPSILCTKVAGGHSSAHFALVDPASIHDDQDDATLQATRDLDGAFAGGAGVPDRVASYLRDAGYRVIDDPRMAVD